MEDLSFVYCARRGHVTNQWGEHAVVDEADSWIDDRRLSEAFTSVLPARLADLIDIAMSVYVVDRISRRPAGPNWARSLRLRIAVRQPDFWCGREVSDGLRDLLCHLMDDDWVITYEPLMVTEVEQGYLFKSLPPAESQVVMFSGGLDSFAGLCSVWKKSPDQHVVLVSGSTNSRQAKLQKDVIREIRRFGRHSLHHVIVPFHLKESIGGKRHDERSQRSRGFLFGVLGAVLAQQACLNSLHVCENGIGAIGLPYTEAQMGAQNTRSTHPAFLQSLSRWLEVVLQSPFTCELPNLGRTKAEMCGDIPLEWSSLISSTVSCDGFPQRASGTPQCGVCTSCLLRRQALFCSGLRDFDPPSEYVQDISDPHLLISESRFMAYQAMDYQAASLEKVLQANEPWYALVRAFPEVVRVTEAQRRTACASSDVEAMLVRLYRTYILEWSRFRSWALAQPLKLEHTEVGRKRGTHRTSAA